MNNAWGSRKKNFYGRDKKQDVISSNSKQLYRMQHQVKMMRMNTRKH